MTPRQLWLAGCVGVAVVSTSPIVRAQTPSLPPLPGGLSGAGAEAAAGLGGVPGLGAGGASALTSAVPAAAAAPRTIFSFFGLSAANHAACKNAICQSQLGLMLNSMLTPVSGLSGGIVPSLCPPAPTAAQLAAIQAAAGATSAEAVAGKIKQDEANAKARVAAVEYLATVDCNRWPDASKALIAALRDDPNECVRFAAARAFNTGCCCSKEVIEALKGSVSGEVVKGKPAEQSPRVKAAAFSALQNCLLRVPDVLPAEPAAPPVLPGDAAPPPPPVAPGDTPPTTRGNGDSNTVVSSFSRIVPRSRNAPEPDLEKPMAQVVEEARATLIETARTAPKAKMMPTGKRSLLQAITKAHADGGPTSAPAVAPVPAAKPGVADPNVAPASYSRPLRPADPPVKGETQAPAGKRGLFSVFNRSEPRGPKLDQETPLH